MENPYCNSVVFVERNPHLSHFLWHHRPDWVKINKGPADICKTTSQFWEQNNGISLKKSGMLKLGLSPSLP